MSSVHGCPSFLFEFASVISEILAWITKNYLKLNCQQMEELLVLFKFSLSKLQFIKIFGFHLKWSKMYEETKLNSSWVWLLG